MSKTPNINILSKLIPETNNPKPKTNRALQNPQNKTPTKSQNQPKQSSPRDKQNQNKRSVLFVNLENLQQTKCLNGKRASSTKPKPKLKSAWLSRTYFWSYQRLILIQENKKTKKTCQRLIKKRFLQRSWFLKR